MVSRRTMARIVFLWELLTFPGRLYRWRTATVTGDSPPRTVLRWLISGVVLQIAYAWAYDHDLVALRSKPWRNVIVLGGLLVGFTAYPRSTGALHSLSVGVSIGRIGYRLWYGVLRPLPGTDDT